MKIDKECMLEMAELIANAVVGALKQESIGKADASAIRKSDKSAYQKTEQLLYGYNSFKKIVADKQQEIAELRAYGVPDKSKSIVQYTPHTCTVGGTVLPEESVERAVEQIERSVQTTVQAIALIEKCMASIATDPYYKVLPMRYFEGRTLEDIGATFKCDHTTISRNKNRLVKELAMRLFPDDVMSEYLN